MMAAVIPEAAEAVSSGEGAVTGAAASGRARGGRHRGSPSNSEQRARRELGERGKRAGRNIARAKVPGNRSYQPVILVEFLLAVLIVALAPIAKGGDETAKAKGSPSPYSTNSLKQILATGVVFFVLAILSSGRHGRLAAWFGGLVLVALGIQQTSNGGLLAIFRMFAPGTGAGLGTYPADTALPNLSFGVGQFSPGVVTGGISVPAGQAKENAITSETAPPAGTVVQTPDATGNFPTLEPGGTITNNVTTNGLPPSVNLA